MRRKVLVPAVLLFGAAVMFAASPRRAARTRTPTPAMPTATPTPPIGIVEGRIKGRVTGKPIEGAKVFLCADRGSGDCRLHPGRVATTDASGAFRMEAPPDLYYVFHDPTGKTEAHEANRTVSVHFAPMLQESLGKPGLVLSGTFSVPSDRGMPADGKSAFSRSWGLFKILGGSRFTLAYPGGIAIVEAGDGAIATYGGTPGVLEIRNGRPLAVTVEKDKTSDLSIDAWGR